MVKIKTVILAHPTSEGDPLLLRKNGEYLFPQVLRQQQEAGLIFEPIISISSEIDDQFISIISRWNVLCISSNRTLPQHRLEELVQSDDSDGYLLLTPYSYLLEKERIDDAIHSFSENNIQCINYKGVSSSNSFCICDRQAIRSLANYDDFAVTPFVTAKYLLKSDEENVVIDLKSNEETSVHSLLNMLLYYGDKGILPQSFIFSYFSNTHNDNLFSEQSYTDHLAYYFNIEHFDDFSKSAARLLQHYRLEFIAGQIHLVKRVLPFLPENKSGFLELGFGPSPLASQLLLNVFEYGYAIEPYGMKSFDCDLVEYISHKMTIPDYIDLEKTKDGHRAMANLSICTTPIQECNIPDESVDFIFSKSVFEHVKDVPGVSRKLYDVLKPGGSMYHIIDFRDHVDTFSIRFDFLKYDMETWASLDKPTNLWRVNDIVKLWEEIGFNVDVVDRISRILEIKDLHQCWEAYDPEDLFCYHAIMVANK